MGSHLFSLFQALPGLAMSFVALLRHTRATHHLTADMGSHLFSLFQALLPDGGDVVADLRPALEVRPVPVHAVCEVVCMLPGVPGQLVLHPRARVPAELSSVLHHLLSASIAVPVETFRLCDFLVRIPWLSSTSGHQVVLFPCSRVPKSLGIFLHHLAPSTSVPHKSLRPGSGPSRPLLVRLLNCTNAPSKQQLPIVARLGTSLCIQFHRRLVGSVPDEPLAGSHPSTAGGILNTLLVSLVLLHDEQLLVVAAFRC